MNPAPASADPPAGRLVIGVDAGGTKTEAALACADDAGSWRVISRSVAGPGNLQTLTLASVADNVLRAVRGLGPQRPDRQDRVAAICFCMAGAGNDPLRERFAAWAIDQRLARQTLVTHDAHALIQAGTTAGYGVALIAGTGSMAYARTRGGQQARCGGWGNLIGDEGSAYWLTLQALRAASHAIDGRGPPTRLVTALAEWLDCPQPQQWPAKLRTLQPAAIAAAAPLVSQLAAQEDAVAAALVIECAEPLSQMIVGLAQRCFAAEAIDLALAGGLILQNRSLRQAVLDRVGRAGVRVDRCRDVPHPVEGALRMAVAAIRQAD